MTAEHALGKSGYSTIDYTINHDATVYDAVQKFAAFNIGCLVTVDEQGKYRESCGRSRENSFLTTSLFRAHTSFREHDGHCQ